MTNAAETADADLVEQTLGGNRDAFGRIVSRYQSLICSLAYSATGSLGQSEDLAQETFITAWKHLRHLRERNKLRAWLCGIARNRINSCLRREGREPLREAESLESIHEAPAAEPLPHDQTISNEEAAILWRSLERIPEIYREPLILFYREHQSIERVAEELELTEDAVKQRLSRGRKLLQEQVLAFVEGALERTNPGKAFTVGVLAALPLALSTSAKAAVLGAAAAKGTAAAKITSVAGMFNAILGPILGLLGPWIQYRMFLASATSEEQRHAVRKHYRKLLWGIVVFGISLVLVTAFGSRFIAPLWFAILLILFVVGYVLACVRFGVQANRLFWELRAATKPSGEEAAEKPAWEYRTDFEVFGLPLIHIRLNKSAQRRPPVKAWIAIGDSAIGLLFAFGGAAIAPFAIGGISVGLISWGGAAVGLFSLGGFALGGWAFGGFAVGWESFGGCALALKAAWGALAVARDFAFGATVRAAHANNDVAAKFMDSQPFFIFSKAISNYIAGLNLLWLIPLIGWWRLLERKRRSEQSA